MKLKWIATCTSALFLIGLFASSLASAQGLPVKGGVIHACVKTKGKKKQRGTIRVVKSASQCKRKKGELPVTWNLQGPAGAAGTQGAPGSPGTPGATGAPGAGGAQGARGEAGSAATAEGQLKEIITKQSNEIQKLSSSLLNLTTNLGSVENTLDGVEKTVNTTVGGLTSVEGGLGTLQKSVGETTKTVTGLGTTVTGLGSSVGGLETITNGLKSGTETLTKNLAAQCTTLGEAMKQGNGLLGVVGKIIGVPVIGGALPGVELPKETKLPIC